MKTIERPASRKKSRLRCLINPIIPWAGMLALGLLVLLAGNRPASARVQIWDNDIPGWTTTFADGDPIDTGLANSAVYPQPVAAPDGKAYVTYTESDGTNTHVYLSRYLNSQSASTGSGGSGGGCFIAAVAQWLLGWPQ